LRLHQDALPPEVIDQGDAGTVRLAFHTKRRQGALILQSAGDVAQPAGKVDRALVRAVVLARRWALDLECGAVASISALAAREGLCSHYTARLLPLAYLAPDLVEQVLEGRQPRDLNLRDLSDQPLPIEWEAQRWMLQRERLC
jgi:hypothetical protein